MELQGFKDYNIADISGEDILNLTELEENLSTKMNKHIVLIAYQPNDQAKN